MDPLLGRLAHRPSRRLLVVAVAAGGAVLAGAVVVAGVGASGNEASLPAVAVTRAPAPAPTPLLVQVSGEVRRPGLVSIPSGSRAVDAVAAAGGPTKQADEGGLNLAAPLVDGQQVVVPRRGAATSAVPAAGGSVAGPPVSLSAATAAELETLPRIGPALAARILAWRTANGGFRSVDDLGEVSGIGPKTLEGLRDLVTL